MKHELEQHEKTLKAKLRKNTILCMLLFGTGLIALIPGFQDRAKISLSHFCFMPESEINNQNTQFCRGENVKTGVSWVVQKERNESPHFSNEVNILRITEVDQTYLYYSLTGLVFLFSAYFFFVSHTKDLEKNLPILIANIKAMAIETEVDNEMHLELHNKKRDLEKDYILTEAQRNHEYMKTAFMTDAEREDFMEQYKRQSEIDNELFHLKLAEIRSTTRKFNNEHKPKNVIDDPWEDKKDKSMNANAKKLEKLLKEHENGWLWDVVDSNKPIWLIGSQGGGKSSLASAIILCRKLLFNWDLRVIVDAHYHKNKDGAWKYLSEVFPPESVKVSGAYNDYEGISTAFIDCIDRWNKRTQNDEPIQSLFDEITQLSIQDECKDTVKRVIRHSLSDVRKAAEYCIFIAHTFTNSATGNAEGFRDLRDSETIQIRKKSINGKKPLPNVDVTGLYDQNGVLLKDVPYTIPDWMVSEKIYSLIKG